MMSVGKYFSPMKPVLMSAEQRPHPFNLFWDLLPACLVYQGRGQPLVVRRTASCHAQKDVLLKQREQEEGEWKCFLCARKHSVPRQLGPFILQVNTFWHSIIFFFNFLPKIIQDTNLVKLKHEVRTQKLGQDWVKYNAETDTSWS